MATKYSSKGIKFFRFQLYLLGSRLALMEIKAILFYLLLKFSIESYEKTQIPLKMGKTAVNTQLSDPHWKMIPFGA